MALHALPSLNGKAIRGLRIADQGCGKLRHYRLLAPLAKELFLVDTNAQLTNHHKEGRRTFTVEQFAEEEAKKDSVKIRVLRDHEFERSALDLDCVFSIAVFDVVPPQVRRSLISSAVRNLKLGGWFVLIIPRNDTSILRRCTQKNRHKDGHQFSHHGIHTFYRNFRETDRLVELCRKRKLSLVRDLSRFHQVCLLFAKARQ